MKSAAHRLAGVEPAGPKESSGCKASPEVEREPVSDAGLALDSFDAVMEATGLVIASLAWLAMVGIFVGFFGVLVCEFWKAVL